MRKRLMWTLALGAVLALAVAGVATAFKPIVMEAGNLVLEANGGVKPTALPKKKMAPITVNVSGNIRTKDGTPPAALRETVIDFDKNGTVNAKGLPACPKGQLTSRSTTAAKKACPKAIVGKGSAEAEVAFPESTPFKARGPLILFNGGTKGGTTLLYLHFYASVPAPTAIITTVKITKIHAGRYGIRTVSNLEQIAGGSGSAIHFDFKVHRIFKYKGKTQSYVSARCSDGHFNANVKKALFLKEAEATVGPPSTELSGTIIRRCISRG